MPQGLQCWNAAGVLVLDLPDRITRILGSATIASGSSGTITHASFATGNIWFMLKNANTYNGYTPQITVNNTTHQISYAPRTAKQGSVTVTVPDVTIIYGVY